MILPNADEIEYLVDGLGRRVGKKENGTLVKRWLFKDQLEPVAEIDEASGNIRRFIYASRAHVPDLMIDNTGVYRLLTDQLGSVRLVVRVSDGNVVQHVDYDPWGAPTVVTGDWGVQSFGFAGGVYDSETGFVRFGARDYDAGTGRWTSADPARWDGPSANFYEYSGNDPINLLDMNGEDPCKSAQLSCQNAGPKASPFTNLSCGFWGAMCAAKELRKPKPKSKPSSGTVPPAPGRPKVPSYCTSWPCSDGTFFDPSLQCQPDAYQKENYCDSTRSRFFDPDAGAPRTDVYCR